GHDREEQVAARHLWRGPEGNDESEIKRMPDHSVERWCFEWGRLIMFADQIVVDLLHPEKAEVIDQISRGEDETPTNPEQAHQDGTAIRTAHIPDDSCHWLPLPIQQKQNKACQ